MRQLSSILVFVLAVAATVSTQSKLYEYGPTPNGRLFGYSVAGLGDTDRDGHDDYAIGDIHDSTKAKDAGAAHVYSGRTGKLIRSHYGDALGDWAGHSVAGAGDFDRDGYADILVGIHGSDTRHRDGGIVRCYSGKIGKVLAEVGSAKVREEFGIVVRGLVDVDRDGVPVREVLIGKHLSKINGWKGHIACLSGKTGSEPFSIDGPERGSSLGWALAAAGDVNRDRIPDFVCGMAKRSPRGGAQVWTGRLFSGRGSYTFFGQPCRDAAGAMWSLSPLDKTVPHVRGGAIKLGAGAPVRTIVPTVATWHLGLSKDWWGTNRLPLALPAPFLPGCMMRVAPQLELALPIADPKAIRFVLPIPRDAKLVGLELFVQCGLFATWQSGTRRVFGLHMTDAVQARIGS